MTIFTLFVTLMMRGLLLFLDAFGWIFGITRLANSVTYGVADRQPPARGRRLKPSQPRAAEVRQAG